MDLFSLFTNKLSEEGKEYLNRVENHLYNISFRTNGCNSQLEYITGQLNKIEQQLRDIDYKVEKISKQNTN